MKLTKQKLIKIIKEEIGRVTEESQETELPDAVKEIIRDPMHMQDAAMAFADSMLLALHKAGVDIRSDEIYWPSRNYVEALGNEIGGAFGEEIVDIAYIGDMWDAFKAPGKLSYPEPGFSEDE
jgi:hypothetical protein